MIRAFACAPIVWSQNGSSISLELIKIQATGSARHASTTASLFARLEDQYMNLGWQSMVLQFSVSSRPPQPSLHWWVSGKLYSDLMLKYDLMMLECLCWTNQYWFQCLKYAHCQLYAQVRTRSLEGTVCSLDMDTLCCHARWEVGGHLRWEVCPKL